MKTTSTHSPRTRTAEDSAMDRRRFLTTAAVAAAGAALAPRASAADRDWSSRVPVRYPDPDIVVLDQRFAGYKIGSTPIQKLWTGALWAEGCAWDGVGRYLVWSDIPNNRQMRLLDEDGPLTVGGDGGSDGIRCDVDGNVWSAAGWAGDGYDGVHIFSPEGKRIGMILLPEICGKLCFGGEKRNRLCVAASQSLYAVYVETQGAHIT